MTIGMAGDEQPIGQTFMEIATTTWLPDQSGIVFIARGSGVSTGGGGQLWLQPYPSGPVRRLTNDSRGLPERRHQAPTAPPSSPSASTRRRRCGPSPLDGKSEPRKLPSLRYDGIAGVSWTADNRILFTTPVKGEQQIWMMDSDGSNRRPITTEGIAGGRRLLPTAA